MRTLLIVPTYGYTRGEGVLSFSDFPSGYGYIAASLKQAGHEVIGLSLNNKFGYPDLREMVKGEVKKALGCQPRLVGIGGICTDYLCIRDVINTVRKVAPLVPIVLGGGIVTHDAEHIMNDLKPDFCIIGEAEETIVKLADMVAEGRREYDQIDNLGYWRE